MRQHATRRIARWLAAAPLAALAPDLLASPSGLFDPCVFPEPEEVICSARHPGGATTAPQTLSDGVSTTTGGISDGVGFTGGPGSGRTGLARAGNLERITGAAAGDVLPPGVSTWVGVSYNRTENELRSTKSKSTLKNVLVGIDRSWSEDLVIGLALGFEDNDVTTFFNGGEQSLTGFTIAPYLAYAFNDIVTADASIGYTHVNIDQNRLDGTLATPTLIDGDTDAERWFAAGNVNFWIPFERFAISMRTGVVMATEERGAVFETGGPDAFFSPKRTLNFAQVQLGGELIYFSGAWEPFVSLFLEHDATREDVFLQASQEQPANARTDVRAGIGVRYFGSNGLSGALEGSMIKGRDDIESYSIGLVGRYEF